MNPALLVTLCLAADDAASRNAPKPDSAPKARAPLPPDAASDAATTATASADTGVLARQATGTSQPTRSMTAMALDSQQAAPKAVRRGGSSDLGSLFAVKDPEPRSFALHDLITIVVNEQSKSKSTADAKNDKNWQTSAAVDAWVSMDPSKFGEQFFTPLAAAELPSLGVGGDKTFKGKGSYNRADDFSARVTAEVVEVRPNGLLVLEARREIANDGETQVIVLSGICRPEDVDAQNQVQSQRIADAVIKKTTSGQLRDTTEKGLLAKLVDALFAF